jgi:hypothetical protein
MRRVIADQLTSAGELWSVPADHPARARLRPMRIESRRKLEREYGLQPESEAETESALEYYITRSLLQDVVDAAGAVEYSLQKLIAAADEAQTWVDTYLPARPAGEPAPTNGAWASTTEVRLAYLELANLLTWIRAVDERMDRSAPGAPWRALIRALPVLRRLIRPRPRVGLLNCLAPGLLRDEVIAALKTYRRRTSDARLLANYALHAAFIPGGGTPSGLIADDGRLLLRVPDRRRRSAEIFDEFTFESGREARTYAAELLAAVEEFVEALVAAFGRARPTRFGGPVP